LFFVEVDQLITMLISYFLI